MRLLDTHTGHFVEEDPKSIDYAILSHTWDKKKGEQTYKQLRKIQKRYEARRGLSGIRPISAPSHAFDKSVTTPSLTPSGFAPSQLQTDTPASASSPPPCDALSSSGSPVLCPEGQSEDAPRPIWDDLELSPKIREACAVARANGFRYIWIDSCCIDKSSSSELSEAINSMYAWYACAVVCYAYLADVPAEEDPHVEGSRFRESRWFMRGWTLQELIAPRDLEFLSQDWAVIGSKHTLVRLVESITGIDEGALLHLKSLDKFSVSQRFSWASKRETTRVEDEAYSLLGLFDINMPTLYGEGERAFRRLQEEVMQRIPDQSLFAWGSVFMLPGLMWPECSTTATERGRTSIIHNSLCDQDPSDSLFATCASMFGTHNRSIQVTPISRVHVQASYYQQTEYTSTPHGIRTQFQMIPLSQYFSSNSTIQYLAIDDPPFQWYLAILRIERCRQHIKSKTVYIPHPDHHDPTTFLDTHIRPHKAIKLVLFRETCDALVRRGYAANLSGPDQGHPNTHWLSLSKDEHTITVEFQHTLQDDGRAFTIEADLKIGSSGVIHHAHSTSMYRTCSWTDRQSFTESGYKFPYHIELGPRTVEVDTGAERFVVELALEFAGMGFYLLRVDILSQAGALSSVELERRLSGIDVEGDS